MLSEKVPPGYVGMIMKPGGLTGEVLPAGTYACWGRDKMVLIETLEFPATESLSVLCADDLNFKFDLKTRSRLRSADSQAVKEVLSRQGAKIQWKGDTGRLFFKDLYATYVSMAARPIARTHVSKRMTTEIRENRELLVQEIQKDLLLAMKGTPVEITLVAASNFDYPDVITKAVERKREREIAIQEEKAKQAVKLLEAENRLLIANKMKAVLAAEAEADAARIGILGKALTPQYLDLKRIERDILLYQNVMAGDKVIVTNGNAVIPVVNSPSGPVG